MDDSVRRHKMMGLRGRQLLLLPAVALLLWSCTQTQLAVHVAKEIQRQEDAGKPVPYKVGKPYQIKGVWYYPREDPNYDRSGIASWYGPPFHGRRTANGEIYDMNALTAAHKTLPMPTWVRVTNLENDRSLVLRVNDRGPFVHGRIIDVSKRASQLLGFHRGGTAKVRVTVVGSGREQVVARKPVTPAEERTALPAVPRGDVAVATLAPPPGTKVAAAPTPTPSARPAPARVASTRPTPLPRTVGDAARVDTVPVKANPTIYVQAGAFTQATNANKMRARLSWLGPSEISTTLINGQEFFRVRIGPIYTVDAADGVLQQVIDEGIADARIIVD